MTTMMLHASEISFLHPKTEEGIVVKAEIQTEFKRMLRLFD